MCCIKTVVISALLVVASAQRRFPAGFKFGAATAAYQIEGGWNASDKGESIWDRFVHTRPDGIRDRSTGDVACDSYHLWREDVKLAKNLNLDFYRFSISWPRLLPTGYPNRISKDGLRYYSELIDSLLDHGLEPVVTLYHWDLPQTLQHLGGWTNPLIATWFTDYARVVFDSFGSRVKTWLTINEPIAMCDVAYTGSMAPGISSPEHGSYICTKNVLLAHATAYRLYEKEYKHKYHGQLSLANQMVWMEPETSDHVEEELAQLALDWFIGRYSHPIYSAEGGWPPALERYMAQKSKQEGYPRSRLPAFTREEIELIRGSYDFYGINHYTSRTVSAASTNGSSQVPAGGPNFIEDRIVDIGIVLSHRPQWPRAATSFWLYENPPGIRDCLNYLQQQYGDLRFLISENGEAGSPLELDDRARVDYYREYLAQVLLAINEDGVDVFGYTAWSLMDNFEWTDGYASRFGLHHVDFSSPLRTRTPRRSARYYAQVARTHDIDAEYSYDMDDMNMIKNILIFIINNY